jgi:hypothetical protein
MRGDDDIEDQNTQILSPIGYTYAEITKEEIFAICNALQLVSGSTERASVGFDLKRMFILQREPFLTWVREWAGQGR